MSAEAPARPRSRRTIASPIVLKAFSSARFVDDLTMTQVFFNGRFLDRAVTGVERYALEIIRAVDALRGEEHKATHGLDFTILRPPPGGDAGGHFAHIPELAVGRHRGYRWEQFDLPRYARHGILINLCNLAPLRGTQSVTCVHDANVFLMPGSYGWRFRVAYWIMLPLVIRRSSRWLTVSRYSAMQLLRLRVADRPPSAIVGNGSDHMLRLEPTRSRLVTADLPRPFVLALASKSRHKNVNLLLGLSGALQAAGLSIVFAGGSNARIFNGPSTIAQSNVVDLGRIEDCDVAYLCSQALCFALPSFYEGFGIPAIEAMACGCPVVAANSSALPELIGDAAILCSPTDPHAWLSAITGLATNPDARARLAQCGRERAARYSWRAGALQLLEVIGSLAHAADLAG